MGWPLEGVGLFDVRGRGTEGRRSHGPPASRPLSRWLPFIGPWGKQAVVLPGETGEGTRYRVPSVRTKI